MFISNSWCLKCFKVFLQCTHKCLKLLRNGLFPCRWLNTVTKKCWKNYNKNSCLSQLKAKIWSSLALQPGHSLLINLKRKGSDQWNIFHVINCATTYLEHWFILCQFRKKHKKWRADVEVHYSHQAAHILLHWQGFKLHF